MLRIRINECLLVGIVNWVEFSFVQIKKKTWYPLGRNIFWLWQLGLPNRSLNPSILSKLSITNTHTYEDTQTLLAEKFSAYRLRTNHFFQSTIPNASHCDLPNLCELDLFFIFLHELAKRANTFKPSAKTIWKQAFVLLAWTWTLL